MIVLGTILIIYVKTHDNVKWSDRTFEQDIERTEEISSNAKKIALSRSRHERIEE